MKSNKPILLGFATTFILLGAFFVPAHAEAVTTNASSTHDVKQSSEVNYTRSTNSTNVVKANSVNQTSGPGTSSVSANSVDAKTAASANESYHAKETSHQLDNQNTSTLVGPNSASVSANNLHLNDSSREVKQHKDAAVTSEVKTASLNQSVSPAGSNTSAASTHQKNSETMVKDYEAKNTNHQLDANAVSYTATNLFGLPTTTTSASQLHEKDNASYVKSFEANTKSNESHAQGVNQVVINNYFIPVTTSTSAYKYDLNDSSSNVKSHQAYNTYHERDTSNVNQVNGYASWYPYSNTFATTTHEKSMASGVDDYMNSQRNHELSANTLNTTTNSGWWLNPFTSLSATSLHEKTSSSDVSHYKADNAYNEASGSTISNVYGYAPNYNNCNPCSGYNYIPYNTNHASNYSTKNSTSTVDYMHAVNTAAELMASSLNYNTGWAPTYSATNLHTINNSSSLELLHSVNAYSQASTSYINQSTGLGLLGALNTLSAGNVFTASTFNDFSHYLATNNYSLVDANSYNSNAGLVLGGLGGCICFCGGAVYAPTAYTMPSTYLAPVLSSVLPFFGGFNSAFNYADVQSLSGNFNVAINNAFNVGNVGLLFGNSVNVNFDANQYLIFHA